MIRAALYARVSSDAQRLEGTIESQVAELKRYIAAAGHVLVKEYLDDGHTGADWHRPALGGHPEGPIPAEHVFFAGAGAFLHCAILARQLRNLVVYVEFLPTHARGLHPVNGSLELSVEDVGAVDDRRVRRACYCGRCTSVKNSSPMQ